MLSTRFQHTSSYTCFFRLLKLFGLVSLFSLLLISCGGGAGTVGTASSTALFTTAASSIAIPIDKMSYTIGGGTAIYRSTSSNSSVATTTVSGNTLNIVGITSGVAQITVTDAAGSTVTINVTVGSGTTIPPALYVTAPSAINLALNLSATYTIAGGKPNYIVSSSNTAVATVGINGSSFIVTGLTAGTAQIVVFDSLGDSVTINVTVGSGGSTVALYSTAPSSVSLELAEIGKFTIGGGTGPYATSSSNASVAGASIIGNSLSITGKIAGTAQVMIFDANGDSITLSVTVGNTGTTTPLFTAAPSTINLKNDSKETSFAIGGGKGPYTAASSNDNVVTAHITDSKLSLKGISIGEEKVLVFDSLGSSITISVNVNSGIPNSTLYLEAASLVTLPTNSTGNEYKIIGGLAPYSVSSNNTEIAKVSIVNTNKLSVSAIAAGTAQIIVFDSTGQTVNLNVIVAPTSVPIPLNIKSASDITMDVGDSDSYIVGGGSAPYTTSSSSIKVAQASISGNTLSIKALSSGTAQILVFDNIGNSASITVTVNSNVVTVPLFVISSSTLVMNISESNSYVIGGGSAPYTASSSSASIAQATVTGNSLKIDAFSSGTAQILVFDSTGSSVNISVNVNSNNSATPLHVKSASAITLNIGDADSYLIGGGIAPYSATSSAITIVKPTVSGNSLRIDGLAEGTGQILVFDSVGTSVNISVTVNATSSTTPFFVNSASTITMDRGESNSFAIGGGTAPYSVSSNNAKVATASISGNSLIINALTTGTAQILAFDANSASITINVTVIPTNILQINVQPENATGNVGDILEFLVNGGSPIYTVTVNNPSIASVTPTTVISNGGSFTARLLNAGSTDVTITDTSGQSKTITLTSNQLMTSLRLSPSTLTVAEDNTGTYSLNIYGGTGPYAAFTSDQTLTSVSTTGSILTVGLGTNLNRCINPIDESGTRVPFGTFNITLTVVDSLGASATSILTIKDNGVGTGSVVTQPAPFVAPCQ